MFGALGALIAPSRGDTLEGFFWGAFIGALFLIIILLGMSGWDWLIKKIDEGKALAYVSIGLIGAIVISLYFAFTIGKPACIEYSDPDTRGGCVEYADDGFKASNEQRWEKFWSTLTVASIITILIALLVHSKAENNRKP